jgi:hypothetical protein
MTLPLIKKMGYQSFADNHGTRYWQFEINPHFYGLKRHFKANITHYSNDFTHSKKYHVWIEFSGCIAPKDFNTDSFREAFNFLLKYTVKPSFRKEYANQL